MTKKNNEQQKAPESMPQTEPAPVAPPPAAGPSEIDVLKDRLLRLQADFDNFRKRSARERSEWAVLAAESLVQDLIPVLDHFELGMKTAQDAGAPAAVVQGFRMVQDQLLGVLRKAGASPIDAHESAFDPRLHDAVAHIPSAEHPADAIISQTRKGWKLGEKMIRPVQVVVSSGPGAPRDDEVKGGPANGNGAS